MDRVLRAVALCAFVLLQIPSLKLIKTEEGAVVRTYRYLQKQREKNHGTLASGTSKHPRLSSILGETS